MTHSNRLIIQVIFTLICATAQAQFADQKKPAFYTLNNIGLLNGNESAALQVQTIQGVGFKNWFAGAGAALDYYRFRTVPLFLDLRHQFGQKKNKWFVYADGGTAIPWVTAKQKTQNPYTGTFHRGNYYDVGAGYSLGLGKRQVLLLSAGFSQLEIHENADVSIYNPGYTGLPYTNSIDRYDYRLKRLMIKLGLSL